MNIASGGNVPSSSPNRAKVFSIDSGLLISAASVLSRSVRNIDFSRAVSALAASSAFSLFCVSSASFS